MASSNKKNNSSKQMYNFMVDHLAIKLPFQFRYSI